MEHLSSDSPLTAAGPGEESFARAGNGAVPESTSASSGAADYARLQATVACPPLRTMIFVDGTWLYYCMHERGSSCPITFQFGDAWEQSHTIDWSRLPALIGRSIEEELVRRGGSRQVVDVVKTVVFTSVRKETGHQSKRVRFFQGMQAAHFDVNMATTPGPQEKCVDIALAVEMMHYAHIPGAYDLALLVTGDMDFAPAMQRVREQGKRVALVTFRQWCNAAMVQPGVHLSDYSPVFLENHLSEFIFPAVGSTDRVGVTKHELVDVVVEILESEGGALSSRDLGRRLQVSMYDNQDVLSLIKHSFGSVHQFVKTFPKDFIVVHNDDPTSREFVVSLRSDVSRNSDDEEEEEDDDEEEEEEDDVDDEITVGKAHRSHRRHGDSVSAKFAPFRRNEELSAPGGDHQQSLEDLLVSELQGKLRELNLPVSGRKAELVERVLSAQSSSLHGGRDGGGEANELKVEEEEDSVDTDFDEAFDKELVAHVQQCLVMKRGVCSGRDIGRYLTIAELSTGGRALTGLKERYGGLKAFLMIHPEAFHVTTPPSRAARSSAEPGGVAHNFWVEAAEKADLHGGDDDEDAAEGVELISPAHPGR
uniref:SAP domain-containing protein n=1 Tax=Rhizochromulina marina TaxID=1034831 RepID=A0A7S2R6D8_9STRA